MCTRISSPFCSGKKRLQKHEAVLKLKARLYKNNIIGIYPLFEKFNTM